MVVMTQKLLDRVNDVARREAKEGDEPNRSRVIRRLVGEGLERMDAATKESAA